MRKDDILSLTGEKDACPSDKFSRRKWLLLRVTSEPLQWQSSGGSALALAGLLQFLGALAWVTHIWPRVKER